MTGAADGDTEARGPAVEPAGPPHDIEPPLASAEGRRRSDSVPILDVLLDPTSPARPKLAETAGHRTRAISPTTTAVFGTIFGLLIIGNVLAIAAYVDRGTRGRATLPSPSASAVAEGASSAPGAAPLVSALPSFGAATAATSTATAPSAPGQPSPAPSPASSSTVRVAGPFRVSSLAGDATVRLLEATVGRRSFLDTAVAIGVPRSDAFRIVAAMHNVHNLDHPRRHDAFSVALDRDSGHVRAFEYVVTPTEIYQARETENGQLVSERVDMHLEEHRQDVAVVVAQDLATSFRNAGLEPSIVDVLDDAFSGRLEMSALRLGARLRVAATRETSFGSFVRYVDLPAIEYLAPDDDTGANALRLYHYKGAVDEGYFDAHAKRPFKGAWRSPIPGARVSSGFNMHRMHPVLHVVRPHTGVDFAASAGTPVYAAFHGTIISVGPSGPSGNLVLIDHGDGFTTGYAHLSRFAPGLHAGQSVETRQLIGYVGSTGRSTGPHLHFSTRKNGTFVDPLRLKLDGERVLARGERHAFNELKIALDRELDAIPLPNVDHQHVPANAKEGEAEDELDVPDDASAAPAP